MRINCDNSQEPRRRDWKKWNLIIISLSLFLFCFNRLLKSRRCLRCIFYVPVFVTASKWWKERWGEGSEKMEGGREEGRKDGRKHKSASNLADSGCSSSSDHMMAA